MRIRSFSLENTREGPIKPLRLVLAAANLSRRLQFFVVYWIRSGLLQS